MSRKFKIILGVIVIFGIVALWATHRGYKSVDNFTSLEKYGAYLGKEFPKVEHISTSTLSHLLRSENSGGDPVVVIDCRKPEEFEVSHIAGAVNLQTSEEVEQFLKEQNIPPGTGPGGLLLGGVSFRYSC